MQSVRNASQFEIAKKCRIWNLSVDGLDIEPGEARLVPNICLFHLTTSTMMPAPQKVKDLKNKTFVFVAVTLILHKPLQLYSSPCGTCWWTRWAVVPVHRNPENILLFLLSRFLIYPEVTFSNTCWCCWWRGGAPRIVRGRSTVFPMFGDELIARERLGDELTVDKSIVFPDVSSVSSVAGSSWSMRTWIKIVKVTTDCIDSIH